MDEANESKQRICLTIAYDGSGYAGWQLQVGAVTVQQRLEEALGVLFPSKPRVHSSSRTDTGVHAAGMVAHFDVFESEWRMTSRKLVLAVNSHLPPDIRVLKARETSDEFHARFSASGKQYRYLVWNHPAHHPLLRHQAWHVTWKLDVKAMQRAAASLVGRHDFLAFSATPGYERRHSIRTMTRCSVMKSGPKLTFVIEADGFLYKMCRGIVGTLIQVGGGKFAPESLVPMLESRDRKLAGMTAPPEGLVLWEVYYKKRGGDTVESDAELDGDAADV
jgi:tRNA pseudouridine38-40 synthase